MGFKNANMTKALQHRSSVSGIRQWVVNALALAIILITAILATPSAQAQTYTVLYSFTGGADGANPSAQLILDPSSNLYGTTGFGGYLACVQGHGSGCGVVFKLDGSDKETVLFTFTLGGQGLFPGGVIRDKAGNIYGTAGEGGGKNFGVVFKLFTDGQERVLHSFKDSTIDGANPDGNLLRDAAGDVYGTACVGGASGGGTIFKVHDSHETTLYNFTGMGDGGCPGGLTWDADGNLAGTAYWRGSTSCNAGCGVIFKLNKGGGEFTVLHSFSGTDGANPTGSLVRGATGDLWGATSFGGGTGCGGAGCGVVFKLGTTGRSTVLHSFSGTDGAIPNGSLLRDAAGNLYGTTFAGGGTGCGGAGCGVVFKLDKTGIMTVLHNFSGTDGANPSVGLTRDSAGNLYGTTYGGGGTGCGGAGCGVVFKITP